MVKAMPRNVEHWVLIALMNIPKRRPFLMLVDSIDSKVESTGEVMTDAALAFVYNTFLRE